MSGSRSNLALMRRESNTESRAGPLRAYQKQVPFSHRDASQGEGKFGFYTVSLSLIGRSLKITVTSSVEAPEEMFLCIARGRLKFSHVLIASVQR